jgi:hypothetical protein
MFGSAQTRPAAKASISAMSSHTPYARAFRRAIEVVGSAGQLAAAVGASIAEIEAWAAGAAHPPASAFLKAIDVIEQGGWAPAGAAKP